MKIKRLWGPKAGKPGGTSVWGVGGLRREGFIAKAGMNGSWILPGSGGETAVVIALVLTGLYAS